VLEVRAPMLAELRTKRTRLYKQNKTQGDAGQDPRRKCTKTGLRNDQMN